MTQHEAYPIGIDVQQTESNDTSAEGSVHTPTDDKVVPLPTRLTLPKPISMWEAMRRGWHGAPAMQFYLREAILGVIICMAQIPESIAFAYLARVRPPVALHAAWVIGVVCALLGGRPGMINGATGAFAAIVATFLDEPATPGGNGAGVELLFPSVMLAGVLMLGVWALRLDRLISLLPLPVMIGFCNGLAIVILLAQLHPFNAPVCAAGNSTLLNGTAHHEHHRRQLASGACTASGYKEGAELGWMLLCTLGAMAIMEFVPKLPKPTKLGEKPLYLRVPQSVALVLLELPSSMLSILFAIALEFAVVRPLGFRTDTIGDKEKFVPRDALPRPFFVDDHYDMSVYSRDGAIPQIITQGILLCAVGCIESLMTAEVVSGFTKTPHHAGLVVGAMGVGNVLSGFLGGMGGNAMIGLSTIACLNGGRGRVAPLATALGILLCVSCAYEVLNFIPMAALAGIMIVVVLHTFKWFSLPMLVAALLSREARDALSARLECCPLVSVHRKVIRSDVLIMLTVSVLVVFTNIVLAVGIGLGLACAVYAWQSATTLEVYAYTTMRAAPKADADAKPKSVKTYEVHGPLFFAATRAFTDYFTVEDDPEHVVCTFHGGGALYDYTIMDAIVALTAAYHAEGKRIEFHALRPSSVKMLHKARHWTKAVEYVEDELPEHPTAHADGNGDYSKQAHIKRRITGLNAPSWSDVPGPGVYQLAPQTESPHDNRV